MMLEKLEEINFIFKNVPVYRVKGDKKIYCNIEDYIETRKKQGKSWSEKSFCDWCDDNDIIPVG